MLQQKQHIYTKTLGYIMPVHFLGYDSTELHLFFFCDELQRRNSASFRFCLHKVNVILDC